MIFQNKKRGVVSPTKSLGVQNISRRNLWKNLMGFAQATSVEIAREANLRSIMEETDEKLAKANPASENPKPKMTTVEVTSDRYLRPSVSRRS